MRTTERLTLAAALALSFATMVVYAQEPTGQEIEQARDAAHSAMVHNCIACCLSSGREIRLHFDVTEDSCAQA